MCVCVCVCVCVCSSDSESLLGPELTLLTKRAGKLLEEGKVSGEDVAAIIAYLEKEGEKETKKEA